MNNDQFVPHPQQDRLLRVCRIGRAQGLKGEVNVFAYTDEPERRFSSGSTLVSDDSNRQFIVTNSRRFKNRWILSFDGIDNRTAAEALNGIELYTYADVMDGADDDAWYLDDLVDLEVRMAENNVLGRPANETVGTVLSVIDSPAQQLLEIKIISAGMNNANHKEGTTTTGLIPFVEELVPDVCPEQGYITIDPPKGLLEL